MITLLSDFGSRDAYVAAMKGAIASIAPEIPTCDLTHQVPAQNILAARFNLMMAYPYFPKGTVHLAVVDPGVGSSRRAIALQTPSGFFVGPDYGLFCGVIERESILAVVNLTNTRYWRTSKVSATFHGRDIFAPVAAHLASGVPSVLLGDRISPATLVSIDLPRFQETFDSTAEGSRLRFTGSLQYIDSFGNLISNLPARVVPDGPWQLSIELPEGPRRFDGVKTYSDVPVGSLAALVGSHGWVEVACNGGSAFKVLSSWADIGSAVTLFVPSSL